MRLDPLKAVGHIAVVRSLKELGPDLSARRVFRIMVTVLKVHGFNESDTALHFLNGHKLELTL